MEYPQRRLRPVRRPRPVNGNHQSRVLRPVIKKNHRGLWVGGLLLLVIGMAALCLVYIRDAKKGHSAKTYRQYAARAEPTSGLQSSERERWGQTTGSPGGCMQNNEAVQLFINMGFRESTSRAMAEELERELQRKIESRSSQW